MCYPADHDDGNYIPNWIFWFVLQLNEYAKRGGDRDLIEQLRTKVDAAFEFFQKFHNEDGLLEGLEGWVFIEWSAANNFIHDVNYPATCCMPPHWKPLTTLRRRKVASASRATEGNNHQSVVARWLLLRQFGARE
jgi:hypothetical protein